MADKLMVARKSFITNDDDGKRVVIRAGKTRVRASHPIAQAHKAMFKDADSQPDGEDTTARPGAQRREKPAKGEPRKRPAKRTAAKKPAAKKSAPKKLAAEEQVPEGDLAESEKPETEQAEGNEDNGDGSGEG